MRFAFFDSEKQSQIDHPCNFYKPVCSEKEAKLGGIKFLKFVGSSNEFVLIVCKGSKKIELIDYMRTKPDDKEFKKVLSKSERLFGKAMEQLNDKDFDKVIETVEAVSVSEFYKDSQKHLIVFKCDDGTFTSGARFETLAAS